MAPVIVVVASPSTTHSAGRVRRACADASRFQSQLIVSGVRLAAVNLSTTASAAKIATTANQTGSMTEHHQMASAGAPLALSARSSGERSSAPRVPMANAVLTAEIAACLGSYPTPQARPSTAGAKTGGELVRSPTPDDVPNKRWSTASP